MFAISALNVFEPDVLIKPELVILVLNLFVPEITIPPVTAPSLSTEFAALLISLNAAVVACGVVAALNTTFVIFTKPLLLEIA